MPVEICEDEDIKFELASYWCAVASLFDSAVVKVFWLRSIATKN
jgi:hypothetical protein